ncbi:MAG: hypothetical protein ACKO5X_09160 [Limnohabitans sp.]
MFVCRRDQGLALPTVLALSMVSGVLLLACWRNIALAQAWSRHHAEQWQLRQVALSALLTTADAISQPNLDALTNEQPQWRIPTTSIAWQLARAELPDTGCAKGLCRPLLGSGNLRADWLGRTDAAYTVTNTSGMQIFHWVEILPHHLPAPELTNPFTYRLTVVVLDSIRQSQTGWQAVWQPSASTSTGKPVRMAELQRILELLP